MTNTTHTPGPLHISHFNKTDIVKNRVPGTYLASCYYGPESGIPLAEAEANARLIAAAPDLFKLVKRILSDSEFFLTAIGDDPVHEMLPKWKVAEYQDAWNCDFEQWADDARAVITKAEGHSCP